MHLFEFLFIKINKHIYDLITQKDHVFQCGWGNVVAGQFLVFSKILIVSS